MIGYSTITQKGQVTIPISIRRTLGLATGEEVIIMQENGGAVVRKAHDFFSLRGSVQSTKHKSFATMRRDFKKYLTSRKKS